MTIDRTKVIDFSDQEETGSSLFSQRLTSIEADMGEFIANALFITIVLRHADPNRYGVHLTLAQSTPGYPKVINRTVGLFNLEEYCCLANRLLVPAEHTKYVYQLAKAPEMVKAFVASQQVPMEWKAQMESPEIAERICVYSRHNRQELEKIASSRMSRDKSGRLVRS